jgi:hypothetical protein
MVAPSLLVSTFDACEGDAILSQNQANTTSRSISSNNSHEDHFILSAGRLDRVGSDPVRLCEDSTVRGAHERTADA